MGRQKQTTGKMQQEQPPSPALNHQVEHIRQWLGTVRFRRCLFGGVQEADVWKKIAQLNALYEAAVCAERARYDALLNARTCPGPAEGGDEVGN